MTPEEVAAVTAVTIALEQQRAEAAAVTPTDAGSEQLSMWVEASRRSAQRALLQRGPWRLSGRLGRRSRT
jgi:hypothetical protein